MLRPSKIRGQLMDMPDFSDVQAFIDSTRRMSTPAELDAALQAITRQMGFDHFALIHHVDLSPFEQELGHMAAGQLIALSDYPEAWIQEYITDEIVSHDPVLLASQRSNVGFSWDELPELIQLNRAHVEQLERGRRAGIGNGYTVPSNVPGESNGSCNFVVKAGRELPSGSFMMAELIGSYAFQAGRTIVTHAQTLGQSPIRLAPRQLDCIALVGRGKSNKEISRILGISPVTVNHYIDEAMRSYGAHKRIQLVLRCVRDGHLALSDTLR